MNLHTEVADIESLAEDKSCPVHRALDYINQFLAGPMCGRCFPCAMGSYEARIRLKNIAGGGGVQADLSSVKRIASLMLESSMCKKGKDTARCLLEWIDTGVFEEHIQGRCPQGECLAFIEYRIVPEDCTMCGLCRKACRYKAIIGEEKRPYQGCHPPFEIRQKRCVKCGECVEACPTRAIVVVGREASR